MATVQPIKDAKKLEALKKKLSPRDRLLVVMGLNSALRISDLLKLKVGDVYDKNGRPKTGIELKETKTGKPKTFPFNRAILKELRAYAKTIEMNPDGPLFPSRKTKKGKPVAITRHRAYAIIQEAAREVGIMTRIGTHTLRKTWGYFAYQSGVPLEKIMKALNHSTPVHTLRYIGIEKEDLDNVYLSIEL